MRIVSVSLGLALLAFPAYPQTLVIPDNSGGGWVFGPTTRQSGPLLPDYGAGQMILTPALQGTIHPNPDGSAVVIDQHGRTHFLLPDYGTGAHYLME